MNLARTTCTDAIALARRAHYHAGVRCPGDIDVELIAFDYGICSISKPLPGHAGNLVRLGSSRRAIVAIEESAFGTPRGSFTLAHELGHHLFEPGRPLSLACFEAPRTADYYRGERRADVFAIELVLPENFVRGFCEKGEPTIAFVRGLATTFRTSLSATALRFVDFAPAPCSVVLSRGGVVLRHAETDAFPFRTVEGFEIGRAAFAYGTEILGLHEKAGRPERVRGDHWSRTAKARKADVFEHSMRLGQSGLVLTFLTLE